MVACIVKYKHDDLPKPGSELGVKVANYVYEWYRYSKESRIDLEFEIWPKCDDAYHCFRELPENHAMQWADTGDQGETDLKDAIDFLSDAVMLALMGRDDGWFQPVSYKTEEQGVQNIIRDYLAYRHREGGTREQYGLHVGQTMRRGTSAITLEWKQITRMVRLGTAESLLIAPQVSQFAQDTHGIDVPVEDVQKILKRERVAQIDFNGPIVRPLDMYDVFLDPIADIRKLQEAPMATLQYKTPEELQNTFEEDGETLFYSNLEGLKEWSPHEVYMNDPMRYRSTETMGINPFLTGDTKSKFVPVLIFHKQVLRIDDKTWVDCYFHVALTGNKTGGVLIACQENPSDQGRRDVFVDTYRDWLNCAYGISAIEKSLPDWNKKNVSSALGLNASLLEIFPPLAVIAGLLADDNRLDATPGGYNLIPWKPGIETNFVAPLNIARGGAENSMQYGRYLGQKILGQVGAYGSIMQDPTKSLSSGKTATQINTETTSGSVGRDNFLEKLTKNLEHLCQAYYDLCRQYEQDDMIKFIQNVSADSDGPAVIQLSKEILDQDRRIVVTGWHGLQNKQQEIDLTKEILQVLTQGNGIQFLPTGPVIAQDVLFKLLGLLGLKNIAKYKTDPAVLLIQQPGVQQELNQMMMQLKQLFEQSGVPIPLANTVLTIIANTMQIQPQPQPVPGSAGGGTQPPGGSGNLSGGGGGLSGPPGAPPNGNGKGPVSGPAQILPPQPTGGQEVG